MATKQSKVLNNCGVELNIKHWTKDGLAKFKNYFGPSDFEQKCAEELYWRGIVYFYKKFPLVNSSQGGINKYMLPDFVVAVNPVQQTYTGTFLRTNKDVVWIRDEKEIGEDVRYWAVELANHDSTIACALIERRDGGDRTATNQATANSINNLLKRRAEGEQMTAVVDEDIAEYKLIPRQAYSDRLLDLMQARQITHNLYKESLGIPIDTDKRSQSLTDEIEAINALSSINKDHIKTLAEKVHKMYELYKEGESK